MTTYAISPELQTKIVGWRAKAADGTLTLEECREYVKLLRDNRLSAATASAKALKGSKPKKITRSAEDLLNELEGL